LLYVASYIGFTKR